MKYFPLFFLLIPSGCSKTEIQSALCMEVARMSLMEQRSGDVSVFDCLKISEEQKNGKHNSIITT